MSYAIKHEGRVFTPDGQREIKDVAAHNAAIEAQQLATWKDKPETFAAYIVKAADGSELLQTWLGTHIGRVVSARSYRTNLSRKMTAYTVRGNNGATYHCRMGENTQLARLRKTKGSDARIVTFDVEVTDTFGGEANYSWVDRYSFKAADSTSDAALMRRAKAITGYNGVRGRSYWHGDSGEFRPYGACIVLFVNYRDE